MPLALTNRSGETVYERRERINLEKAIALSKLTTPTHSNSDSPAPTMANLASASPPFDPHHIVIPDSQGEEVDVDRFLNFHQNISQGNEPVSPVVPSSIIIDSSHISNPNKTSPIVSDSTVNPPREPGWSKSKFQENSPISTVTPHLTLKHLHPQLLSTDPIEQSSLPGPDTSSLVLLPPPIVPETPSVDPPSHAPPTRGCEPPQGFSAILTIPDIPQVSNSPIAPLTKLTESPQKSSLPESNAVTLSEDPRPLRAGKRVRKQSAVGQNSARSLHDLLILTQPDLDPAPPKRPIESRTNTGPSKNSNEPRPESFRARKRKSHVIADSEDNEVIVVNLNSVQDKSRQDPQRSGPSLKKANLKTAAPPSSPLSSAMEELEDVLRPTRAASKPNAHKRQSSKAARSTEVPDQPPASANLPVARIRKHITRAASKATRGVASEEAGPSTTTPKPKRGRKPKQHPPPTLAPTRAPSPQLIPSGNEAPQAPRSSSRKSPKRLTSPANCDAPYPSPSKLAAPSEAQSDDEVPDETEKENIPHIVPKPSSDRAATSTPAAKKSLAELIASTRTPNTKSLPRRYGLPREDRYRLHRYINPNPHIQKQVKTKRKKRRGEYDSGEDSSSVKNDDDDDDDEKESGRPGSGWDDLKKRKKDLDADDDGDEGHQADEEVEEY